MKARFGDTTPILPPHPNKGAEAPSLYGPFGVLASRARMVEEFAALLKDIGAPRWRIRAERKLAQRLWQTALSPSPNDQVAYSTGSEPVQLLLPA